MKKTNKLLEKFRAERRKRENEGSMLVLSGREKIEYNSNGSILSQGYEDTELCTR